MQRDDLISAFRHHRHDVLNGLQLIRGYVQLNRQDDAIRTLDRLAQWIQSLSMVQSVAEEHSKWFAAACQAPHVRLIQWSAEPIDPSSDDLLAQIWAWLEEEMGVQQIQEIQVRIANGGANPSGDLHRPSLQVGLVATQLVSNWWNSLNLPAVWTCLCLVEA